MRIQALDPSSLSQATADALARVANAATAVDAPHRPPESGQHLALRLRYGWDDRPSAHLLAALSPTDAIVAFAGLEYERWDNLHAASVSIESDPAQPTADGEDRLLERAEASSLADGRTMMFADAWVGSRREKFWRRHGYTVASRSAQRRLVVADLDWTALDRLYATAVATSGDYDIVTLPLPAPDDVVPGLLDLHHAMNDSPMDALAVEDEVWSEERLRNYERAMTNRGIRLYRLLARRRGDRTLAGHTVVAIEDERPNLAFQEDTAVIRGHRGHRLGLRLKLEMLRLLRDVAPDVEQIDTWNAESNAHMIAVNDALGCVVVGRNLELQKSIGS